MKRWFRRGVKKNMTCSNCKVNTRQEMFEM